MIIQRYHRTHRSASAKAKLCSLEFNFEYYYGKLSNLSGKGYHRAGSIRFKGIMLYFTGSYFRNNSGSHKLRLFNQR